MNGCPCGTTDGEDCACCGPEGGHHGGCAECLYGPAPPDDQNHPTHPAHQPHATEAWGVAEVCCLECGACGLDDLAMLIREPASDGGHLSVACELCGWAGGQEWYSLRDPLADADHICAHLPTDCGRVACGYDCPAFVAGRGCHCDDCMATFAEDYEGHRTPYVAGDSLTPPPPRTCEGCGGPLDDPRSEFAAWCCAECADEVSE